jgi:hypothetical protein
MELIRILSILILLASCSRQNNALRNDFISDIENKADTDELITTIVDTDFEWQLMYVVPDWYSENAISDIIGFEWKGPTVPDQYSRYLFVDTVSRKTDYFDYYNQGGLPQIRKNFDYFSSESGGQVSYICKENCKFK